MRPKYQIFVSSTYEDLKDERDIAIKSILEMGHIPVGMEMFSAGDEEQWELIKRQIDDSDYYVVIVAHRYGSTDGGISYTEKEYDYATSLKVPVLGFLISETSSWPATKMDKDAVKLASLANFKTKIKKKIVNFWSDSKDLHALVSIALSKATTAYPRPGWVRATTTVAPEVANELSRLSKENAELREASARRSFAAEQREEEEKENARAIELLKGKNEALSLRFVEDDDWCNGPSKPLYSIFQLISPQATSEVSVNVIARLLALTFKNEVDEKKTLAKPWPMPSNRVKDVLAYFQALGLMSPSSKKHAVSDKDEYWTLTPKGARIHSAALVRELELALEKKMVKNGRK